MFSGKYIKRKSIFN